ncbi:rod shape-determining protein MreD [Yoonia sp. R2331]|uniref:rod shape-determining protein MreD n=1 Tax=Yoonia sp. R2331 TaxID=3237238 RepID=UPI0034E4326D
MAETPTTTLWLGRAMFLGLALVLMFLQLVPLNMEPGGLVAPDLLLAVTVAWIARRPDYAPFYVIAAIYLLSDLLFQRPPGLWAALVLIMTEMLRARTKRIRDMPILLEWGSVAVGIAAITLANRIVLAIVMMPQAPLGLTLILMLTTIAVYPVVVLVAHFLFGVTRTAPGAVDSLGHRL